MRGILIKKKKQFTFSLLYEYLEYLFAGEMRGIIKGEV